MVNWLIKVGMDLKAESKDGRTVLHLAAQNGHLDLVNLLMEVRANPNGLNIFGTSPLHYAVYRGNGKVMRRLA